jgi:hypothetical protein
MVVKGELGLMPLVRNKAFAPRSGIVERADLRLTQGDPDPPWTAKIRQRVEDIAEQFEAKAHEPTTYQELQSLAGPIRKWSSQLSSLAIVDELLGAPAEPNSGRDAAVFTAAVIVYERRAAPYFDRLVRLASVGRPVRGAAMWRLLRAIKRLVPDIEPTDARREMLLATLANCARCYDSRPGERFRGHDIVRMIRDIARLRRTGLQNRLADIFSAEQLRDLAAADAQPKVPTKAPPEGRAPPIRLPLSGDVHQTIILPGSSFLTSDPPSINPYSATAEIPTQLTRRRNKRAIESRK